MGPRTGLDAVEGRKMYLHLRESKSDSSIVLLVGTIATGLPPPPSVNKQSIFSSLEGIIYILSLFLWLYSPLDLGRFFSFLIHTKSAELPGRRISPSQSHYLHTEQHKYRINAHRHPCLEWDSNPRSQCSSAPRRFMP
jgi:hypothetical protein